ncbi:MAG TPA: hypothetical protein VK530_09725 [Candidatus Acidoferrum sp.]|nr:hypothetical protein [Candidatus Acidoferrum sp.]
MEPTSDTQRFYFTPVQRVIAALVIVLVVSLCVVVVRVPPRADRIWDWRYPDASAGIHWPAQPPYPAQSMLSIVNTNASNVFAFYRGNRLPPGTGAMFTYRRGGMFSRRNTEELGVIPSPGNATNARSELLLQYKNGQSKIILSSQVVGDSNTAVWVNMVENKQGPPRPIAPFFQTLEYPGSLRASGGSILHGSGFTFTVRTNLAAVESYYARSFGTNAPKDSAQAKALQMIGDPRVDLFRLPSPPRVVTNEVAFLLMTARTMSLIHAVQTGSNTTMMSIGTIAR